LFSISIDSILLLTLAGLATTNPDISIPFDYRAAGCREFQATKKKFIIDTQRAHQHTKKNIPKIAYSPKMEQKREIFGETVEFFICFPAVSTTRTKNLNVW